MLLRSLLLCHDHVTVQLINRGFKEFNVEIEVCSAPEEALHKFTNQRFDAVVIDDADHAAAAQLLDKLKLVPSYKKSLTIVLVDPKTRLGAAFSTGGSLAIYKPLSADRLRKSLRALHNLIGRSQQRKFDRIPVRLPARICLDGKTYVPALILDISQSGAALSVQQAIPNMKILGLEFALPGRGGLISISADVVWQSSQGRLGAQFSKMELSSRRVLSEWTAAQLKSIQVRKGAAAMAAHA
jgi:DNA-binding NarL/FixJ family response regulator